MIELSDCPVIAEFSAYIRRPEPLVEGVKARLYGENGVDADAIMALGKSAYQDARVHVDVRFGGEDGGGFEGYVRRPKPGMSGMTALIFAENGESADQVTALGLSKFLDRRAHICVRLVQHPSGAEAKKKDAKGPYSAQAQKLWRSSFFRTPTVWAACGGDDDYLAWVRTQPCCINPKQYGAHAGDIVPMHVRRVANGAGVGRKPPYSAIPGCVAHHTLEHQKGESSVGGRPYYDEQRIRHLQKWAWDSVVSVLGFNSMTHVPPATLRRWAVTHGLDGMLPLEYCDLGDSLP